MFNIKEKKHKRITHFKGDITNIKTCLKNLYFSITFTSGSSYFCEKLSKTNRNNLVDEERIVHFLIS